MCYAFGTMKLSFKLTIILLAAFILSGCANGDVADNINGRTYSGLGLSGSTTSYGIAHTHTSSSSSAVITPNSFHSETSSHSTTVGTEVSGPSWKAVAAVATVKTVRRVRNNRANNSYASTNSSTEADFNTVKATNKTTNNKDTHTDANQP